MSEWVADTVRRAGILAEFAAAQSVRGMPEPRRLWEERGVVERESDEPADSSRIQTNRS